jgi:tripartite-type tricarboxylate transporter receptor subunit TctC
VTKSMPYDTFKDLVGVTMVARAPLVFVTRADFPASSPMELAEVIRKSAAGKYSYGSSESVTRLLGAMFAKAQHLDMVHVPYKGGAPMMTDVAAGVTTVGITSVLTAKQLIDGGRLRAIALTGSQPSPILPGVMTMTAGGLKDFEDVYTSYSLYAPSATPHAALERMQQEVAAVANSPEMRAVLFQQGATPVANSVTEFNKQVERDAKFWAKLAHDVDLQPE